MHQPSSLFARALFALTLFTTAIASAQIPTWPKTTPADVTAAGIGVQLTGADYGNSTFVLAAYFGGTNAVPTVTPAVFTSADGTAWTRRTLPVGGRTGAPRFLNGKFFLGLSGSNGGNGVILSSTDGITWTSSASLGATVNAPNEFAFGGGLYVGPISSSSGQSATQVTTSTDGITWTNRVIVAGASSSHVTFFKKLFYATCYGSTAVAGLYSSPDGIAWTKIAGAPANPGILAATSSTLLVTFFSGSTSGQSLSTDGVTFATASPGINLQTETIKVYNDAFLVTASPSTTSFDLTLARASLDGRTWASIGSTANVNYANEVAFGGDRYVFVGEFNVFAGASTVSAGGTAGGGSSGGGTTPAPTVSAQPAASQSIALGGSVTFTFTVTGTGVTYQWYFNGVAISGAINFSYTIASVTAAHAGNYTVTATNAGGTVTSSAATLAVAAAGSSTGAYLSNLSIRAFAGSGSQTLIVGLTVGGAGTSGAKNVLVRGVGPTLAGFGLAAAIADPKLTAFAGATAIATNDNWVPSEVQTISAAVGAFALTAGSKDAAFLGTGIAAGSYSIVLEGVNNSSGVALAELYDTTPSANVTAATPRFTNVSSRTFVGTGDNTLICGFVVGGTGSRRLLVRAVGPGLAQFNLTGLLADPQLALFNGSNTKVAENDNWDSAATLAAQQSVGAFALPAGSKDAVLVATVTPGSYTVTIVGAANGTGTALIELYELP